MKVYVRAPYSKKALEELENLFEEVVYEPWTDRGERYYEDELLEKLQEIKPDILITELDRVTQKVLENYKDLKVIGDCRANPANIDVKACTENKVPVLCTPARNAQGVAEYLIGILLYYYRNLGDSIKWVQDKEWKEGTTPYFLWRGNEIYGKKVGLVALGAVGRKVAKLFDAFGAHVSYYDPYVDIIEGYQKKTLEEIFSESDIVSLHLPVTEETREMIDMSLLSLMKKDSVLINTSRSEVVNTKDLEKILSEEKIGGFLTDVLDKEPPKEEELRILKYKNVVLTPHIAGATFEVVDHQSEILNDRLKKWLEGEDLNRIVFNKEVI